MDTAYRTIYMKAASNAARRSMPFDLTWEDMVELIAEADGHCVLTGIPFTVGKSKTKRRPFTPSLDRKDSSLGYTRENCRIVCCAVNLAMNEWGEEIFRFLAHSLAAKDRTKGIRFGNFDPTEYGLDESLSPRYKIKLAANRFWASDAGKVMSERLRDVLLNDPMQDRIKRKAQRVATG